MKLMQIVLIIAALIFVIYAIMHRQTYVMQAWKKIGLAFLGVGAIVVILVPQLTNAFANSLGIGRGADLLLYVTVFGFLFFSLSYYISYQELRHTMIEMARQIALREAEDKYRKHFKS